MKKFLVLFSLILFVGVYVAPALTLNHDGVVKVVAVDKDKKVKASKAAKTTCGEQGKCTGTCTGVCKETCKGECKGTCKETCKGECKGECKGTCKGECKEACKSTGTACCTKK
jgi:hypothetical protein